MNVCRRIEQQYSELQQQQHDIRQTVATGQQYPQGQAVLGAIDNTNPIVTHGKSPGGRMGHRAKISRTKLNIRLVPFGISVENIVASDQDALEATGASSRSVTICNACKDKSIFEFRVPTWLAQTYNTICLRRSISGWAFSLQVYMDLPDYSEFLCACMNGPYWKVEDLLQNNTSVLYERFNGMTGADVCAAFSL